MPDLAIIIFILLIAAVGWRSGAINILGSFGSWIIGYICARNFSSSLAVYITEKYPALMPHEMADSVSAIISMFIDTEVTANRILQILCFIVIFIVTVFLVCKICMLISGFFNGTLLGLINSGIGAGLGFCFSVLLLGIIIELILPAFGSFAWGQMARAFFADSQFMMTFVDDMLDLFVANIPEFAVEFFN